MDARRTGLFGCGGNHWQKGCKSVALAVKSMAWAAIMQRSICLGCVGHLGLRFCNEVSTHTKNAIWADARAQFQYQQENFQHWDQAASRVLGYATAEGQDAPRNA